MNKSETIIQHIQAGTPKNGWAVFKFNPVSTWFALAWQVFAIGMCAVATNMFLFMPVTVERTQENIIIGYVAAVFGVIFLVAFFYSIRRLLFAKKSFIVITDDEVVKSLCGTVQEFSLKHISRLTLTQLRGTSGFKPRYRIEFVDTATKRFELLADNRYFGDESVIFNTLNSKIS